jgi:hypothetical protein
MQSLNPQFIADDVTDRRLRHRYTRRVGWASVRQNSTLCFPAGHAATNVLAEPHAVRHNWPTRCSPHAAHRWRLPSTAATRPICPSRATMGGTSSQIIPTINRICECHPCWWPFGVRWRLLSRREVPQRKTHHEERDRATQGPHGHERQGSARVFPRSTLTTRSPGPRPAALRRLIPARRASAALGCIPHRPHRKENRS